MATRGDGRGPGAERAFLDALPATGPVRLDADESRHLVRVRRARVGDTIVLFDGRGGTRRARLVAADAEGALLEVEGDAPDREPRRRVVVGCGLPSAGRADDLVASLAEAGVTLLVPLLCARSAPDAEEAPSRRRARWARIVREAAKVNGRSRLLEIGEAGAPTDVLGREVARLDGGVACLLDPDPGLPPLAEALGPGPKPCLLLVGPEGGFTDEEVEGLRRAGAHAASLGACALRTETAALAAAAIALST
jgi:16S rRNA (uracil1498-N3)-methyltransferase